MEHTSAVGAKVKRDSSVLLCQLCGKQQQGHRKYKKKTFCPETNMSSSKGLDNQVYSGYEHFTSAVEDLKRAEQQNAAVGSSTTDPQGGLTL